MSSVRKDVCRLGGKCTDESNFRKENPALAGNPGYVGAHCTLFS